MRVGSEISVASFSPGSPSVATAESVLQSLNTSNGATGAGTGSVASTDRKYFCRIPFEELEIHEGGRAWLCCPGWLPTAVGDFMAQSREEVWNGPQSQAIRASIHDGSFKFCDATRCPWLASKSGPVTLREVAKLDSRFADIIEREATVLPEGPPHLHLSYDRSCNLSCPSCRTSVFMAKRTQRARIAELQQKVQLELFPSATHLVVTGSGDPFAAASFRALLRQLDPRAFPLLRNIHLFTNGLLWTPKSWQRFERVHPLIRSAEISIDAATAETYALNRRGGKFERLLKNLDFVDQLDLKVTLSFVVQANNFREMPAFIRLAREQHNFRVYFSALFNWGTFPPDEYARRAVHLPEHPEHAELLELLSSALFEDKKVTLGNLAPLRGAVAPAPRPAERALRRLPLVSLRRPVQ